MCSSDIFLGFLAILFPPLPVWVKRGICSADSIINILLCVLGFIPGLIHAWYIIAKYPDPADEYERLGRDGESGRVYVYVHHGQPQRQEHPRAQRQQKKSPGGPQSLAPAGNVNYGTTGPSASQQHNNAGEGSSDGAAPPSYAAVVAAGDNKVQSQE
ncbi:hypothetical protein B0T11DRAFT_357131 [Plectosphaerella cucumerina]|uniref:Stress response RCI peptide n=1 Tax=Plectosphaerella cucumerina TaxID=40658 RepID=A0A8K0TCG3_9PEZI|nr:hypothetical protein B0T11DRAFT_357131 [Plectosphaerella cucumerina]